MLEVSMGAEGGSKLKNFKFDQNRSRLGLAMMVIKHELSFFFVEYEFFHIFVCNIQPTFNFISRNTLNSDVMKVYNEEREKLYKFF